MHAKGQRGQRAEGLALAHLEARGLTCVDRNFRCRAGEIDLVMQSATTLVFVEVRSRRSADFVSPLESVDFRKRAKLVRTAGWFLVTHPAFRHHRVRFDVVSVEGPCGGVYRLKWVRDAFRPGE
jgi:putative endonuclease